MNALHLLAAFGAIAVLRVCIVAVSYCLNDARAKHALHTQVGRLYWSPTLILVSVRPGAGPQVPPAAGAARRDGHAPRPPQDGFDLTEVA